MTLQTRGRQQVQVKTPMFAEGEEKEEVEEKEEEQER